MEYDVDGDVLVIRLHGRVTAIEFSKYISDTAQDPRYRPDLSRLILISDDATFPSSATIIQFAAKTAERALGTNVRFACVARTPLAIGISSMFMGNAGLSDSYQVFDCPIKARAWLTSAA
jgi:hypothetical protein